MARGLYNDGVIFSKGSRRVLCHNQIARRKTKNSKALKLQSPNHNRLTQSYPKLTTAKRDTISPFNAPSTVDIIGTNEKKFLYISVVAISKTTQGTE